MSNVVNSFITFPASTPSWSTADDDAFCAGGVGSGGGNPPSNVAQKWDGTNWATVTNVTASRNLVTGGGNDASFILMGGGTGSGGSYGTGEQSTNYNWNGSSWSTNNAMGTATNMSAGGGNGTDAIIFGGTYSQINTAQKFDGTNWAGASTLAVGVRGNNGGGLSTDAISIGGYDGSSNEDKCEKYDGSSWSSTTTFPSAQYGYSGASGVTEQNISFTNGDSAKVYAHDGSSWTQLTGTNNNAQEAYQMMGGDKVNALKFGGNNFYAKTELWDNTSWTAKNDLATAIFTSGTGGNTI